MARTFAAPDHSVSYRDPERGTDYKVGFNLYIDPVQIVLETVWVGGRKVPLRRLSPDLKIRMRQAALEDYEAEGRRQWAALRAQAAERQACAGK